jgi:hypothetical protein
MGVKRMKTNIYQKLHKAACEAGGVAKGKKVQGMMFNPLLHDDVQRVAMEALLNNGLYPICTYDNQLTDNFILVTCNMKIHDVEDPKQFIEVSGCSAMGSLDKFGTGNGMSYAKKYAYLNALHLKTGLDNEDGYKAKPFNKIPQRSGTDHANVDIDIDMSQVRDAIKSINDIYALRKFRKQNPNLFDPNNNVRVYRQITDLYETHETQLNRQGVTQ